MFLRKDFFQPFNAAAATLSRAENFKTLTLNKRKDYQVYMKDSQL